MGEKNNGLCKKYKSGDKIDIKIDNNCQWFHEGDKISNQNILKYFKSLLGKDEKGYYLANQWEKYYITVEDAPFCINYITTKNNQIILHNDRGEEIPMDFENLIMKPNGVFYYTHNQIPMKFSRKAQSSLLQYAEEENGEYFIVIGDKRYKIKIDN